MKPFDESDLIACHLHELSPARERALRQAMEMDPEVAAEFDAIGETLRIFRGNRLVPMLDAAVLERNWQRLRPSLAVLTPRAPWWSGRWGWVAGAGAAALATGLVVVSMQHRAAKPVPVAVAHGAAPSGGVAPLSMNRGALGNKTLMQPLQLPARQFPAQRYNNRPGPLTTGPVDTGVNDALLVAPVEPPRENMDNGPAPLQHAPALPEFSGGREVAAPLLSPPSVSPRGTRSAADKGVLPMRERDIAIGSFGAFTMASSKTISDTTKTQSTVAVPGFVAAFHQQLRPLLGYEVSTGFENTMYNYSSTLGASGTEGGDIRTAVFELTGTYVVQGPRTKTLSTFAGAGGGMLTFLPTPEQQDSYVFRGAAVAMVGAEYHLKRHWGLRAEYRGMVFKGPDFRYTGGTIPLISRYTLSSEPTISLTYRFEPSHKD